MVHFLDRKNVFLFLNFKTQYSDYKEAQALAVTGYVSS